MNSIKIYIVVSQTRTVIGKIIRWYTKNEYNHVSISFDHSLQQCFSFARKKQWNPFLGRLMQEDFYQNPHYHQGKMELFQCDVNDEEYAALKERVLTMYDNQDVYKYNYKGIVGIVLNKPLYQVNTYTCTHFVSELLQSVDIDITEKEHELVVPQDFIDNQRLMNVYVGTVQNYLENMEFSI